MGWFSFKNWVKVSQYFLSGLSHRHFVLKLNRSRAVCIFNSLITSVREQWNRIGPRGIVPKFLHRELRDGWTKLRHAWKKNVFNKIYLCTFFSNDIQIFVFSDEIYVHKYDFIFDLLIRWFHEYFESTNLRNWMLLFTFKVYKKFHEKKIIASKLVHQLFCTSFQNVGILEICETMGWPDQKKWKI